VHDRADAPLLDAQIDVLTPKEALVTSFSSADTGARRPLATRAVNEGVDAFKRIFKK